MNAEHAHSPPTVGPSRGLLSFYDRLRDRVEQWLERRGGKVGRGVGAALLMVPDVFIMMARMVLDEEVPRPKRALLASALAYFILPVDFFPELTVGAIGYLDDLVLALVVLKQAFGSELEPWAARYWSGPQPVRKVTGEVLETAHGLVGADVYERLRKMLAERGINLDEATRPEL